MKTILLNLLDRIFWRIKPFEYTIIECPECAKKVSDKELTIFNGLCEACSVTL